MDSPESEEEGRFVDYFAVCGLDPLDGVEPNELTGKIILYTRQPNSNSRRTNHCIA